MGRKSQNPRYNVLSCRVSDDLRGSINHALGGRSIQEFLHAAVEEKLNSDRQARIDKLIREHRR
ncbi:MAG: hypothetical protein M0023_04315 [Desulfobacteraceae bacterium]|nr:hypothetical protein [Desulfobacteraceae bacterium]